MWLVGLIRFIVGIIFYFDYERIIIIIFYSKGVYQLVILNWGFKL